MLPYAIHRSYEYAEYRSACGTDITVYVTGRPDEYGDYAWFVECDDPCNMAPCGSFPDSDSAEDAAVAFATEAHTDFSELTLALVCQANWQRYQALCSSENYPAFGQKVCRGNTYSKGCGFCPYADPNYKPRTVTGCADCRASYCD